MFFNAGNFKQNKHKSNCEQIGHEYEQFSKQEVPNQKRNGNLPKARGWARGLGNPSNPFDLLRN